MLAVVFLGLAMVACATLLMAWPSDVPGEPFPRLVPHWSRLLATPAESALPVQAAPSFGWVWRRVWDALHYALVLGGLALATAAAFREGPLPWIGLIVVGALGIFYTAGIALYNGPLCATPGYLLVLLGALLAALTWRHQDDRADQPPGEA